MTEPIEHACYRCHRRAAYRFTVVGASDALPCCRRHALLFPPLVRQSLRVALVVGTVLFAINQADVVLSGQVDPRVVVKIALTYLVPYSVSTYSALRINRL